MEILPIAIVVFAVILILMGVKRVPQGLEYTVERFGRYTKTLKPGIQFILPFVDSIGAKVNMMEQVTDVPQQEVITKDNAMVSADGVVFFKVMDAAKSAYRVNDMYRAIGCILGDNEATHSILRNIQIYIALIGGRFFIIVPIIGQLVMIWIIRFRCV